MIYFFRRRAETHGPEGTRYELVIADGGSLHVERFDELAALIAREHELVSLWHARRWRGAASANGTRAGGQ
jgi:hypothetical protein